MADLRRQPKVELRDLTQDYCEFVLSNTDVSVANALRRVRCDACSLILQTIDLTDVPTHPVCDLLQGLHVLLA